jgi:signal transduction histidine kinase/PAS domain-containing protein
MRFRAWRGISAHYRRTVEGHCPWPSDERDPEPILIEDIEQASELASYVELFRAEKIGALAFIPLVSRSRLLGKFMLYYEHPHYFSSAELELATAVARQVAFAVDRKKTEVDLECTREKLALVLRGLADGVTAQNIHGELMFANPAAAEMFGCSGVQELLQTPLSEIWKRYDILDENRKLLAEERFPWHVALHKGIENEMLMCLCDRVSRSERWCLVKSSPALEKDGQVLFAINLFRDVTKERLSISMEHMAHVDAQLAQNRAAFLADASELLASSLEYGRISLKKLAQLAVPRVADWCIVELSDHDGIEQLAIAHGDPSKAMLAAELRRRYPVKSNDPQGLRHVLTSGKPVLYAEVTEQLIRDNIDDGEVIELVQQLEPQSAVVVPMIVRGSVFGAITLVSSRPEHIYNTKDLEMAQSLAERVALAIDNQRLYAEAKDAVQAREDFLAIVSHDLRNPLSVILLKSGLLKMDASDGVIDPRFSKDLDAISRAGKSMERMIRDLFDLSSVEAGHLHVERRVCRLDQLLKDVMELHKPLAGSRSVELVNTLPSDTRIYCDRDRVLQVFSNLIGNAIKFTNKDGAIEIAVSLAEKEFRLSVRDNGVGMAKEEQGHAFERYGTRQKLGRRGLGLGLYITKALIEAHQGRVWLESQLNKGTTVMFTLPVPAAKVVAK